MKKTNLRIWIAALGAMLGAGLGIVPAFAAAEDAGSVPAAEYSGWPDIREVITETAPEQESEASEKYILVEMSDASEKYVLVEPAAAFEAHAYTEEELARMFGGMPVFFDCGSFVLNRLNGLPPIRLSLDGTKLLLGDQWYRVRPTWALLQKQIEDRLSGYQGDWSVYLKDLSTDRVMEINEHSMESASLIKLYIAGAVYEAVENGDLTLDEEIRNALDLMIRISDNESSNVLVRRLCDDSGNFQSGLAVVNDFIARHGFTNTQQVNGIADPSLWVSDGRINMTSAADCGRYLEMVYRGELVSHFTSFRLETLLNKQEVNYKIPGGLPEGVHISHKTGEVDDTENDAAIIYTPYGDYIFCILSTDLTNTGDAVDHIHEITKLVYEYFTEPIMDLP